MEELPRRRRRPALSCLACRRRKIKCDRATPCARCVSVGTPCTYRVRVSEGHALRLQSPTRNSNSYAESTAETSPPVRTRAIHEVAPTEHTLHSPALATEETNARTAQAEWSDGTGHHRTRSPARARETASDFRDLRQRVRKLEELSALGPIRGLAETGRHILTRQAGLRDSEIALKKSRLLRWSDWMGIAPEFQSVYNVFEAALGGGGGASSQSDATKALIIETDELYKKCKRTARSLKVHRPSRCLSSPRPSLEPPPRLMADSMVNLYFCCFESVHRVLHKPSFENEYRRFWDNPDGVSTGQRLKILLVIGIGSCFHDEAGPDSEMRGRVQQWIYTAQAWLSGPLEKDRLDVQGLQVHCLAMLARQVFSIGGDLVWVSTGSLIHSAMQIGLHRDPKHFPDMPLLQAEVRRRLWYTILELLVQSSLDSAMPPRISFEDFDTESPSNINDDELDESTTVLRVRPRDTYTSTAIQLLLMDSLPARLRIVQLLNAFHSELAYPDVLALSSELTSACQTCAQFAMDNRQAGMTAFQRNMCDFLVRRFMIPLHCPFASEARKNPLFHYSQKVSLDAALAFISPEPDDYFSRLMAMSGGMYREGFRCAVSTITLELLAQAQAQREDGTFHNSTRQLGTLKQALGDAITLAWDRIRQGETNIKGPMLLGVVLALANSADGDAVCDYTMAKTARDSLLLCHHILEARANAASLPSPNDGSLASSNLNSEQDSFGLDLNLDFFFPNASDW
ncbi:hypothetical protein F4777DRAFT_497396 [Nemania sp. FL0916]|nr:hypothetical protein F4777DRAFT_497396 [Nemania sp. FL0916]